MEAVQSNVKPAKAKKAESDLGVMNTPTLEMLKDGGIPVLAAYLHQATMLPGTGKVEQTIGAKKFAGSVLTWTKYGLIVEIMDQGKNSKRVHLIPQAAVQSCELEFKKLDA